ncbi:MAG: hypothetical protein D6797_00595 [Bdellovibrio sp.]|nr:MAG: hypothetical protein D6797_00595 [Bdellovibrio sp.]
MKLSFFPLLGAATFLFVAAFVLNQQKKHLSKTLRVPPSKNIRYFTLGYQEALADSFWLRFLQDLGVCFKDEQQTHAFRDGLRVFCQENSWGFLVLDVVTDLAPRFQMPYWTGGLALSVLSKDYKGAGIIFEKGIKNFPNDWNLIYYAATHFLLNEHNKKRAAELYQMAVERGAPGWVGSLSARLYSQTGRLLLGINLLEDFLKKNPHNRFQKRLRRRLKELKAQYEELQKQKNSSS